jgi:hypothetical protein
MQATQLAHSGNPMSWTVTGQPLIARTSCKIAMIAKITAASTE